MAPHKALDAITANDIAADGAPPNEDASLHSALRQVLYVHSASSPTTVWCEVSRRLLRPELPFAIHRMLYYGYYSGSPSSTPPAWIPDLEDAVLTNVGRVLETQGKELIGSTYKDPITSFPELDKFSNDNPEAY